MTEEMRPKKIQKLSPEKLGGVRHLQDVFPLEVIGEIAGRLPLRSLMRLKCVDKDLHGAVDTLFFFFPVKVIREILLRLPVKSLLRFKCVSKKWLDLINDPFFLGPHLERSRHCYNDAARITFAFANRTGVYLVDDLNSPSSRPTQLNWLDAYDLNYGRLKVAGSCDGLLCLIADQPQDRSFYICNPSTRAFVEFLDPERPLEMHMDRASYYAAGFARDTENDDYKVVMNDRHSRDTFVYSLKAKSWRRPNHQQGPKDCSSLSALFLPHNSVFVNNRLHWLVFRKRRFQIAAFDLCSEEWNTLRLPCYDKAKPWVQIHGILQTHGRLCACVRQLFGPDSESPNIDIWMMKEHGVRASWSRLVSIPVLGDISPEFMMYSERGCKFLFSQVLLADFANLVWYDSEQEAFTELDLYPEPLFRFNFGVVAESLASITED